MSNSTKAKPWGDKHRREALRRTYEIAAEMSAESETKPYGLVSEFGLGPGTVGDVEVTEGHWRELLANFAGLDAARIAREVRRVRALAEGRMMRETVWAVRYPADEWETQGTEDIHREAPSPADRAGIREGGGNVVRITRIRKAVAR